MADGKVVIQIELDDGQVVKGVAGIDKQLQGIDPSAQKANRGIKDMVVSLGLVKLASAGFDVLKNSMDGAINRFDTFNKFPTVMTALGYSTEDVDKSMSKLSDGIDGLPTTLDEIVSSAQQLAISTGSLEKGTDTAIALNNAFLASGASAADAARGADQYRQMLAKGEVDLQSWRSLQETMPIALDKVAKAFHDKGVTSVNGLYDALKAGDITFDQFNNKLIELNNGVGGFADLAEKNSAGIKTSMSNLRNAVVKGLEQILRKIDEVVTRITGKNIAENLNGLKGVINNVFDSVAKSMDLLIPIFEGFKQVIEFITPILEPFITGLQSIGNEFIELVTSSEGLSNIPELFTNLGGTIANFLAETLSLLSEILPRVISMIGEYLPLIWNTGLEIVMNFISGIVDNIDVVVESGKTLIDNVLNGIVSAIPKLLEGAYQTVVNYVSYVLDNAPKLLEAGIELLLHLIDGITKALPKLAKAALDTIVKLVNYIISNLPKIIETGVEIIIKLIAGIIKAIPKIARATDEVINNIMEAFFQINWGDIGVNIISGLIGGLNSMIGSLWNKVTEITSGIKDSIQGAFQIHSPSRWMKNFIGKNMMVGWSDGLEQYSKLPIKSMDKAVSDLKLPVLRAENFVGIHDAARGVSNISNDSRVITNNSTKNFEGLFKGANFHWSGKEDIRKTMQEIAWMTQIESSDMNLT